jgi:hypothetical protein
MRGFWQRDEAGLAALDAAVRASAVPLTELHVGDALPADHVFPPTATHFGGTPYLEAGESWPTYDGHPYDFVCQVNLRECPHHPDVPFDLFTVFALWSSEAMEQIWAPGGDLDDACVVRTYRDAAPSKAVTVPRPPPLSEEEYPVRPCPVRLTAGAMVPDWEDAPPAVKAAASRLGDPVRQYRRSLRRLGYREPEASRIGGIPRFVQSDFFEGSDLFLLAQIEYEPPACNSIGDAAPIYVAVSASDPTRVVVDAGQSH